MNLRHLLIAAAAGASLVSMAACCAARPAGRQRPGTSAQHAQQRATDDSQRNDACATRNTRWRSGRRRRQCRGCRRSERLRRSRPGHGGRRWRLRAASNGSGGSTGTAARAERSAGDSSLCIAAKGVPTITRKDAFAASELPGLSAECGRSCGLQHGADRILRVGTTGRRPNVANPRTGPRPLAALPARRTRRADRLPGSRLHRPRA